MRQIVKAVGLLIVGATLALGTSSAYDTVVGAKPPPAPASAGLSAVPATVPLLADTGWSIADIAEQVVASVVNISSERVTQQQPVQQQFGPFFNDPFFRRYFDERFSFPQVPRERRENSLGSGVIVDADGIILTNNHVVENAERVKVTLADGREVEAEIVGTDPPTDLAVLRLVDDVGGLAPLPFGDSEAVRLGDVVLAVGNPFGIGKTVTMGIVSAKGRANVGLADYEDFIQTDAAINPGNSGGALVDRHGQLVGINTAIVSRSGGYQGIGFAIPADMARLVMDALVRDGKVVRGWLGVSIQEITSDLAAALELRERQGILVGDVVDDSPADEAGLERGDIILRFDGQSVSSPSRLRNLVAVAGAQKRVEVVFLRDGKERSVDVKLGELDSHQGSTTFDPDDGALGGLTVAPLDDSQRRTHQIPDAVTDGVIVTEVQPGSAAARAGFRSGDLILEINRKSVDSVQDLRRHYDRATGSVALLVQRGRSTLFLALRKP